MSEIAAAEASTNVGASARRVEVAAKLTGDAVYTSDMALPGMLHAAVKKSPYARARIVSIDTAAAEALPGVRAVLVGSELDYKLGLYVVDKDILAKGVVRHFGEGVAAVAADTLEIAREAVDLIKRRVRTVDAGPRSPRRDRGRRPARAPGPRRLQLRRGRVHSPTGNQRREPDVSPQGRHRGRASTRQSGSSSGSTPTLRCSTFRWRPMSSSPSGRPAMRSRSGRARSRRSPSATCSASRSSFRSTT